MFPASAWVLLPFFLRSARPARRGVRARERRGALLGRVAAPLRQIIYLFRIVYTIMYCSIWRAWLLPAGAWLNGLTRLSEIERSLVRDSVDL